MILLNVYWKTWVDYFLGGFSLDFNLFLAFFWTDLVAPCLVCRYFLIPLNSNFKASWTVLFLKSAKLLYWIDTSLSSWFRSSWKPMEDLISLELVVPLCYNLCCCYLTSCNILDFLGILGRCLSRLLDCFPFVTWVLLRDSFKSYMAAAFLRSLLLNWLC